MSHYHLLKSFPVHMLLSVAFLSMHIYTSSTQRIKVADKTQNKVTRLQEETKVQVRKLLRTIFPVV